MFKNCPFWKVQILSRSRRWLTLAERASHWWDLAQPNEPDSKFGLFKMGHFLTESISGTRIQSLIYCMYMLLPNMYSQFIYDFKLSVYYCAMLCDCQPLVNVLCRLIVHPSFGCKLNSRGHSQLILCFVHERRFFSRVFIHLIQDYSI